MIEHMIMCRSCPTSLVMSINVRVSYDVTTISLDQDEKEVAQTCNWFNNLHQPCRQTQYLLNEEQRFVEVQQTVFDYQIGEKERAKNSSYHLPSRKGTFRNVSQTGAVEWESARRIDTTYDAYDNVTSTVDYLFDSTNNHIKQSTVETNYATTSKNVRVPIRTRTRDDVLDSLEVREYTLTEDERNIAVSRISFQGPGDTELRPWKEQNFQYDSVGRMTTTKLSWSAGAVIPQHTPSSATTKVEYKEPSNGIVCRTEIGAGGHRTEFQQDIRQKSGPIIAKTLPQGQSERFEYDSIGRLVKQINALEQATHHAYEIGPTGSTKTTTSPKGYIVKTVFDVLDREVQVLDNGDPTTPATREPTRMLSEKSYDALGRLQQSSDRFGLTTTYKSDALNRPVAEIDPFGNELGYKFEHGGAAVTHTINGDLRRIVKLDGKDRPIQTTEYPDSSHKDKISPLVHETLYSGHGKPAKKSTFQQSATEKVLLSSEASVYGPEQTVQSELTKGLGSRVIDTVHRLHVVDLFDNLAFYRKIVNYADGTTFEHAGPLQIFNESNQLACYRNQEGKEEHCQYDENGWLRQKTRFDGSGLRYTYDATGRVTDVEYPSGSSTRNTYDEDGRLVETNEDGKILKYAVTLDGTSAGETYSDGHNTNVILDCYSRPVKSTDVFGVSTESEYNSLGQISRSKCHGDTSVLLYGTVNHTFGQQVGHTCSGSTSTQTTTSYDGFGRPSLDVTQDSAGLVLLETSYKYNSRSQIEYQSSKSALAGELNTERRYQYDGLEQLIAETETFDQFTVAKTYSYDGNSNVVAVDTNGDINLLTYNAIDQRTDGGHRYDANGRMMQDNEGQTFTYDERDRLISVTSASQNASAEFGYLSDNRLAHRISSDGYISKFYHDDNLINAIYTSENDSKTECSKTSLTRNASSGIVAYQNEKYAGQALSQRGSIGLVLEADTHISSQYTAYGTRHTSTTSSNLLTDFGLTQGFTDRLSGLVHLGSRFYNPKQMSFLTMDSVHTENRYAYCEGDPVNRIDPTGHSWVDWLLAPSVGAITTLVGTAVANSLFTAALAAVANVALTAVTGGAWAVAMAVAAGVAGAVGGALGSLASNYISDKWGDRQVSGSDYLWGAIAGAAIGGITAGLTSYGNITAGADRALFTHSAKLGASVGAIGGGLREFAAQRIRGEEFTLGSVARIGLAAASGAASGVASGYASRYVYLREQMGRPIAMGVIAKGMWARWTD